METEEMGPASQVKQAKLNIRIGKLEFVGEGEQDWLAEQLRTIVSAMPSLSAEVDEGERISRSPDGGAQRFSASIAAHIKAKGAEGNQTLRFLVTADWLRLRGTPTLSSSAVSKALTDNHQSRLANASDCLNKNVAKGFCEKTKDGFFITPEGLRELGYP